MTGTIIAEGKTKRIIDIGLPYEVDVQNKDDVTAFHGNSTRDARHDEIVDKGKNCTTTTVNVFELLHRKGIKTHLVKQVSPDTFRARKLQMIKLEIVGRTRAAGGLVKRFPSIYKEGEGLTKIVTELFWKTDDDEYLVFEWGNGLVHAHDANLEYPKHHIKSVSLKDFCEQIGFRGWLSTFREFHDNLHLLASQITKILAEAWESVGGLFIDFKFEVGYDLETGELLVGDVIDNDSWRMKFQGEDFSKQAYRDAQTIDVAALESFKGKYATVAKLTEGFAKIAA